MTTAYRLGQTLAMHYVSSALFKAGWVVGSLELLGKTILPLQSSFHSRHPSVSAVLFWFLSAPGILLFIFSGIL